MNINIHHALNAHTMLTDFALELLSDANDDPRLINADSLESASYDLNFYQYTPFRPFDNPNISCDAICAILIERAPCSYDDICADF